MDKDLSHHGIKGMRWGIRRYQNKDGSLTSAGKRRVAAAERASEEYKTAKKLADGYVGALKKRSEAKPDSVTRKGDLERGERLASKYIGAMEKKMSVRKAAAERIKEPAKDNWHDDYINAHRKKSVKDMSDAELRARNNRLQMENQYSQLRWQQNTIAKGTAYATTAVAVYGTVKSVYKNSGEIISAGKKFIEKISK